MSERRNCPECGAQLPSQAAVDLCPKCLLQVGLERPTQRNGSDDPTIAPVSSPRLQNQVSAEDNVDDGSTVGVNVRYFGNYELLKRSPEAEWVSSIKPVKSI